MFLINTYILTQHSTYILVINLSSGSIDTFFTSFVSNSVIFAEFVNPTPVNSKTNCCILKLLKFCADAIKHALPSYAVVIATGSELLDSCIVISFTCDCLDSFKAFPFSQSK